MAGICSATILALLAGAACFLAGAYGIKCIICDSSKDPNCSNAPQSLQAEDCSAWCAERKGFVTADGRTASSGVALVIPCPAEGFTVCRKIKQSATASDHNNGVTEDKTLRACGWIGNTTQKDYEYRTSEKSKSEIYNCITDGCNSSGFISASFLAMSIGLCFSLFGRM
ncbi:hypothetical protein RvY_00757 [Ramazzottius varieornatus]|uniref:Protein quiver n=1 Tax=Ramazzottius varieornatus TaxID=947166 RepID=A0A1D1UHJ5_RAMVA|nr:hypothetical protein RvY_00757 [Ramazzottius varieornatus]